jgi:ornithine cyclodeaminase/alanine dehydrogenase
LDQDDVKRATNMKTLIDRIDMGTGEQAGGTVVMPPRLNMAAGDGFFRVMPAIMPRSGLWGFKSFHRAGKGGVRYLIAVYELEEGSLLALMDAHYLTAARTGATTGVATKYMANPDAKTVGVIGSGLEARTNLQAVAAVRNIERVTAFSPNPQRRQLFADWIGSELGIDGTAADTPEAAVKDVDIVIVATNTSAAGNPVAYHGAWMQPGQHVNSIGSTMTTLREIDADTFGNAGKIVIDAGSHVEHESGDVIDAIAQNKYERSRLFDLMDVVAGKVPGRDNEEQITLFKSVGTAIQDVMAGFAVYEEAVKLGVGKDVGDFLDSKFFAS